MDTGFVYEGATVIGTDVNDAGRAEIAKKSPALVVRKSDAGDVTAIKELADWIKGEFGALDVLVNNAGFAIYANPEDVEETAFTTINGARLYVDGGLSKLHAVSMT